MARKGEKISEETREKMRQAAMGNQNAKGYKHTPEAIEKIRMTSTGRKHSSAVIEKLRVAYTGACHTPEANAKNSAAKMGVVPWNKNVPMSQETKDKLSKAVTGFKHTPEAIEKIKAARAEQVHVFPYQDTKPERIVQAALQNMGISYRKHDRILEIGYHRFDIVLEKYQVAIEVDGCYFHACELHCPDSILGAENNKRDILIDTKTAECGWHMLRIWEHDVYQAEEIITKFLNTTAMDGRLMKQEEQNGTD